MKKSALIVIRFEWYKARKTEYNSWIRLIDGHRHGMMFDCIQCIPQTCKTIPLDKNRLLNFLSCTLSHVRFLPSSSTENADMGMDSQTVLLHFLPD